MGHIFSTKMFGIWEVPHQTWDPPFNMSLASRQFPGKRLSRRGRVKKGRKEEILD